MFQSELSYCGKFGLIDLLHRMHVKDRPVEKSYVGRSSVSVLCSTVATWNVSSPTRCLVLWGRQLCCSLIFPSEQLQETRCQRTDEHVLLPRICQLPLQSRDCGICIKNTHKSLLSRKGVNLPFPPAEHVLGRRRLHPTSHSGCFSASSFILVLFAEVKTMVPSVNAEETGWRIHSTCEKVGKRCPHPITGMGRRREQVFSPWKQNSAEKSLIKIEHLLFFF